MGHPSGILGHGLCHGDQIHGHLCVHRVIFYARFSGDNHQWSLTTQRLIHHADGVSGSHARVKLYQGGFVAGASIAVCHGHRNGFLQGQDVFEVRVILERVQKALFHGAGIAEHVVQAVCQKLLDDAVPPGFDRIGGLNNGGLYNRGLGRGHRLTSPGA